MMQRHSYLSILLLAAASLAASVTHARPVVVEESQSFEPPQAGWAFLGESVAIDGDSALATALFSANGSYEYPYRQLALLYRRLGRLGRLGDTWAFDRVLVDDPTDEDSWNDAKVAMKDGLAAVSTTPLRMFRRTGSGEWIGLTQPFPGGPQSSAWANGSVRIDGSTVGAIAGRCHHGVAVTDKLGAAWSEPELVTGNPRICSLPNNSGALDIDDKRMAFTNPQEDSTFPANETRIYRRSAPASPWSLEATLPIGDFGTGLALRGDELFVGGTNPLGNDIYRRSGSTWSHAGFLPTLRGYAPFHGAAFHIARSERYILAPTALFDGQPAGIAVYRKDEDGRYQHVAQLASSRGDSLGPVMEISGRTVITGGWRPEAPDKGRLYFFELPEDLVAPQLLQDDFEDGNAAGWTVHSGDVKVVRRGPTHVLQTGIAGTAQAVLADSNMTNQSIQAEFRPLSFASGDRWFGVTTHFLDAANHYYAVLRSDGHVTLRRVLAGRHLTLGNRVIPVIPGHRYQLRLENVGSRLRVFVNGKLWLDVFDGVLKAGRAGFVTQGASALIDNVVVTPNLRTPLYEAEIPDGSACEQFVREKLLRVSGAPEWDCTDYEAGYVRQGSLQGDARAAIGPMTGDQIVESRLQLESFADTGGEDQWVGVMTRYTDARNYYYFTLRSSKSMALRKLVDGHIVELGRARFTLGVGDWHVFRLEAIGDRIRAYIDGQLLIEAVDLSHPVGISGFATYRAAARFDYLRVVQP
jgi:hypothetical protein